MTRHKSGSGESRSPLPLSRAAWAKAFVGALTFAMLLACATPGEVIVKTSDGVSLSAEDIDRDPLLLLPGGAALVGVLDAPALFSSRVGSRLAGLLRARLPLPASAGFEPERDLKRLYLGFYSLQGVDFAGVATGMFDPAAIEAAAEGLQATPLGAPLTRVEYEGRVLYISANIGFVVLTNHTLIFGNEIGIRRLLDRLDAGRIKQELPPQLVALLRNPAAALALGVDPVSTPHISALSTSVPAVEGLQLGRIVGDFASPGMNVAGTLTYMDAASAGAGVEKIQAIQQKLQTFAGLAAAIGLGRPLQKFEAKTEGRNVQFVAAFDTQVSAVALDRLTQLLGVGSEP